MTQPNEAQAPSPPRAFTQGVGTVFQFAGVISFVAFFSTCCLSGLLSINTATHTGLGDVEYHGYSGQRAVSIAMVIGVLLGIALSGIGLGLQAQRRASPAMAVATCALGSLFWIFHALFFSIIARSIVITLFCLGFTAMFVALLILAIGAWREMRTTPPPPRHEILPPDYQVPYSHLHQDPPEVRLARELAARREKLEVQRAELEQLEQKLHRKLKDESR